MAARDAEKKSGGVQDLGTLALLPDYLPCPASTHRNIHVLRAGSSVNAGRRVSNATKVSSHHRVPVTRHPSTTVRDDSTNDIYGYATILPVTANGQTLRRYIGAVQQEPRHP